MLTLENVRFTRGPFHLVADWSLPATGRCALIGPSGAGKSTLLDLIAGFAAPDTGRILWNGEDIGQLPPAQRPVSILFQDNNLFPHLSLRDNLCLAMRPRGGKAGANDLARIDDSLKRVGLDGMADRKPGALSGGQQSRGALARVLLQERPILLLDEPFAALGPALKSEMLDLVTSLAQRTNKLVLLVTHDPDDALSFANQTVFVAEGRANAPVATRTLLAHPPPALAAYLGQAKT